MVSRRIRDVQKHTDIEKRSPPVIPSLLAERNPEHMPRVTPNPPIACRPSEANSRLGYQAIGEVAGDTTINVDTLDKHIVITPDVAGGKPRIAGHRITVQNITIWHGRMGKSVDEISNEYELSLAAIYAALAHYFDHREEIDRTIAEDEAFLQVLREQTDSPLAAKLNAHRSG